MQLNRRLQYNCGFPIKGFGRKTIDYQYAPRTVRVCVTNTVPLLNALLL
jgi:hypothetical protein